MANITQQQRITGAIMGAFIGDALALGPHWYYDLDEQHRDYGDWITDYAAPKAGRYHAGLPAGASSQAGIILALTLESLVAQDGYDEADFCRRMDADLLSQLDGTPMAGPGGYTSQSIRWVYQQRQQGRPWGKVAGPADTTEAAERCLAIAARYAGDTTALAQHVSANTALTQNDPTVGATTLAYCLVLGQLLAGEPLDDALAGKLMAKVKTGELPFHRVTNNDNLVSEGEAPPLQAGQFPSPDALLTTAAIARAAQDPDTRIEPAWKASLLYGMPCAVYHQFPAAYYLTAYFQQDTESAILHAVNGGGQNQARAILTGALSGAIGGMDAIPQRLIDGLLGKDKYLQLADKLAQQATS